MAAKNAEVDAPGADGFAILVGQYAGKLMEVGEVMGGPGGEELAERNWAEIGVATTAVKVTRLQVHRS